jgi:hypothetical protein
MAAALTCGGLCRRGTRAEIKNQWARDDPAFVVILVLFILAASLAFCVAFGVTNVWQFARIFVGSVVFEFLLVGFLVASLGRYGHGPFGALTL